MAKRVEELGAGVRLKSIAEDNILQALKSAMYEEQYKKNAVKISDSFNECGDADEARVLLERIAL